MEKSILVLCENFEFRMTLIRSLKSLAPTIYSTWSVTEAKKIIETIRPNLVIFDSAVDYLQVPVEIEELAKIIKAQKPRPKTIVFYALSNEREEVEKLECDLTIQKTFNYDQFIEQVQELLNKIVMFK